jgi:hypothetical protein
MTLATCCLTFEPSGIVTSIPSAPVMYGIAFKSTALSTLQSKELELIIGQLANFSQC